MAFATADDVATRAGRSFTDEENATAEFLAEAATALIADAVGKTEQWSDDLDPVPRVLRFVTVEAVTRAMANPEGLASLQEALGAHSSTKRYRDVPETVGLLLTAGEERLARRVVLGRSSGSSRPESLVDELHDMTYGS